MHIASKVNDMDLNSVIFFNSILEPFSKCIVLVMYLLYRTPSKEISFFRS